MVDPLTRRFDYERDTLYEDDLEPDPVRQFRHWLAEAAEAGIREPNAMTLATASPEGVPSARIVLLRGIDRHGFTWYTNRESLKARDLAANPRAALVFHWELLERQVLVSGSVSPIDEAESAAYFAGRPRRSQLVAWASPQGHALADREELEAAIDSAGARYPDEVPLPPHWGGYRLVPEMFEFWQGRRNRMHDRFAYLRDDGHWRITRLAP